MTFVNFKNAGGFNSLPGITKGLSFPALFNDSIDRMWAHEGYNWIPPVNIKERTADYKIDLAVPGMNKKDFKVEVENNVLTISGERKEETSEENEKHTRREFYDGSFKRSFTLPEVSDMENISAAYSNGILSVTVAKKEIENQKSKKEVVVA